ncbi:hypothetical protein IFR04_006246 [Cadophora malorum]|uniref:Uncharacterized protein n=1 Tax=Cadophora malorum TaxID=108018 RepID=A0A8H7W7R8_9HELO|nr:hypothetical protein IFR04_006246 [Cadophora malorum]
MRQPAMACLPAYNPIECSHGTSLDADPTTHRWPAAYLPSYSTVTPSDWLKEAAADVLRASYDFNDIHLVVKFTPELDSATAAILLSSRRKANFWFWESIQSDSPEDLAKSNTMVISGLHSLVSPRDLLYDSKLMKRIATLWSDLSDDILACLVADGKLTGYFTAFAEARWNPSPGVYD